MQRILVIAPQYLGDSLLAVAFLRELKKHCGRTEIDVLSKNIGCYVFSKCPYVKNTYNIKNINYKTLWDNKYSKVYVLKRSVSAAIIALLTGAKERIGFGGQFRECLLTKVIKYDKSEKKHELEHFFDVLKEDYIEITDTKLEFYTEDSAKINIQKYLTGKKKALIVAKSSTHIKDWQDEYFAQIIDYFAEKETDSYFVGTEEEKPECDNIITLSKNKTAKNLCGRLSLDEVVALVNEMDIVIGVDSGFCHLGAVFNKKVVTLFGPTSVFQWCPIGSNIVTLNLECAPCAKPKKCKKNYECMKNITPKIVIEKLNQLL